jgi:lipopolysaccharide/colanic/teichoic acid biosynthesis glycosyltransferase
LPEPFEHGQDRGAGAKRALDIVLGSLGLVAAVPILLVAGLVMRLSGDRGPFLYRASRVGQGGALFTLLKVRTMAVGSSGAGITGPGDPRITRVGRFLRRYRLDELPQLVNVLRGEMSLVGPRPEDPAFVEWSNPVHQRVFTAKPGITGLAQLEFHDESRRLVGPDIEDRYRKEILPAKLQHDLDYLDRRSLRLDLAIMARTVRTLFG